MTGSHWAVAKCNTWALKCAQRDVRSQQPMQFSMHNRIHAAPCDALTNCKRKRETFFMSPYRIIIIIIITRSLIVINFFKRAAKSSILNELARICQSFVFRNHLSIESDLRERRTANFEVDKISTSMLLLLLLLYTSYIYSITVCVCFSLSWRLIAYSFFFSLFERWYGRHGRKHELHRIDSFLPVNILYVHMNRPYTIAKTKIGSSAYQSAGWRLTTDVNCHWFPLLLLMDDCLSLWM